MPKDGLLGTDKHKPARLFWQSHLATRAHHPARSIFRDVSDLRQKCDGPQKPQTGDMLFHYLLHNPPCCINFSALLTIVRHLASTEKSCF
ncbi:MAG: hypothetical protein KatS3mg110_1485 [Pirellulaceae bacterium]|nr:MAG: hypothetical protein KatS3mg110_1485 [Pirellulaceae bacterium]